MSEYLNVQLLDGVTNDQLEKFDTFAKMLVEKNRVMNLTAITDPDGIAVKHFADSLSLLKLDDIFFQNAKLLDVGTGAGFPGVPLKIVRSDLQITLMDALQKRLNFIDEVLSCLNLSCELLHSRAEDAGRKEQYREKFDIVTARAVASLSVLCEYCLPFVKVGGNFVAMKGPTAEEEISASKNAIKILGGKIENLKEFTLSDGSVRYIAVVKKVKPCPNKYPRNPGKISKSPL